MLHYYYVGITKEESENIKKNHLRSLEVNHTLYELNGTKVYDNEDEAKEDGFANIANITVNYTPTEIDWNGEGVEEFNEQIKDLVINKGIKILKIYNPTTGFDEEIIIYDDSCITNIDISN